MFKNKHPDIVFKTSEYNHSECRNHEGRMLFHHVRPFPFESEVPETINIDVSTKLSEFLKIAHRKTYKFHGLPLWSFLGVSRAKYRSYIQVAWAKSWSFIQLPGARSWSFMKVSERQLAFHITSKGSELVPSTRGSSEKTPY